MAIIVVSNSSDSGIGSLRQAILDAGSGDFIEFDNDYQITLTSGEIVIEKNVTINSLGKEISISGNDASRVFTISGGVSVAINRFRITNGFSNFGGAIRNYGTATLTNSTLSNNTSSEGSGGAIYNDGGTVTITNSTFSANTCRIYGGAIVNGRGTVTITNSTFSNNTSSIDGGAVHNFGGTATITNSTFSGNTSDEHGGAICNDGVAFTIFNSTFSNNTGRITGSAIENRGFVTITNSTLSNNTGVAIDNYHGTLNISFSTIALNPFGIFNWGSVNCKNSILANGRDNYRGVGGSATLSSSGVNFSTDGTCTGFIEKSADALKLGPLALNAPGATATHALLPGSAAIDTVTDYRDLTGNVVATDQRGVSRPQWLAGDAGAYEYSDPLRGILLFA